MVNNSKLVFVDTSVLLRDPDILVRIPTNGGYPVITKTVLDEIDYTKDNSENEDAVKAARAFNRSIDHSNPYRISTTPTGVALTGGDNITVLKYKDTDIFILEKMRFEVAQGRRINNDLRIILTAKHYGGIVITTDQGWKTLGTSEGVEVHLWAGGGEKNKASRKAQNHSPKPKINNNQTRNQSKSASNNIFVFREGTKVIPVGESIRIKHIPTEGDAVLGVTSGAKLTLVKEVSSGGEGTIFTTNDPKLVAKIYHQEKLTRDKLEKIELIVNSKINFRNVCFPIETIKNSSNEIVGYVMPKAEGKTLQSQIMTKPALLRNFPQWKKTDVVDVCLRIVKTIRTLHNANIIIGDINPNNILLTPKGEVYFVDTDSYQIEDYPCPVGTVNFSAPEIQGKSYPTFLRTKDHEIFAIATLIFMILLPGKPPYSRQNGEDQGTNIRNQKFPYAFTLKENGVDVSYPYDEAPEGPWRNLWSNLSYMVKEYFFNVFKLNKRVQLHKLIKALENYHNALHEGHITNDLFPDSVKIKDGVDVPCAKCGKTHKASKAKLDDLKQQGKGSICPDCRKASKDNQIMQKINQINGGVRTDKIRDSRTVVSGKPTFKGTTGNSTRSVIKQPNFIRAGQQQASPASHNKNSNQQPFQPVLPKKQTTSTNSNQGFFGWIASLFK